MRGAARARRSSKARLSTAKAQLEILDLPVYGLYSDSLKCNERPRRTSYVVPVLPSFSGTTAIPDPLEIPPIQPTINPGDATTMTRTHDRVAYATFYCSRLSDESEEDPYFDAVQLLIYQILHRPSTRTRLGIPLLVFVVPHVSEAKRQVFRSLGATVVPIDYVHDGGIQPRRERWIDQLSKLRIFEQVSYDRILYLDADMLLTKSLDGIWNEPVSNQKYKTLTQDSEDDRLAPLPQEYMFVGVPDTYGSRKPDPPIPYLPLSLNGGFWMASPSIEIFNYYTSLLSVPETFDSQYMEQGVFRHAHRESGPMPWKQFAPGKWNVNWPRVEDFYRGTATLHDRFWITDEPWMEPELVRLWDEGMSEMRVLQSRIAVLDVALPALPDRGRRERVIPGYSRPSWHQRGLPEGIRVECG